MLFSDVLATDVLTPIVTDFPAGSACDFFTGSMPAITAAPTGTLLGSLTLPATPLSVTGRTISKAGAWTVTAVANGTPGWFRIRVAADAGTADNTHKRMQGTCAGPIPGVGTVTTSGTAATFSTSQAGVLHVGDVINIAGTNYNVVTFNGTTGAVLDGSPAATAAAFTTRLGGVDAVLDNGVIAAGQIITANSLAITV